MRCKVVNHTKIERWSDNRKAHLDLVIIKGQKAVLTRPLRTPSQIRTLTAKSCGRPTQLIPLFLILFAFCSISAAWSATYYVDATKGDNKNNGLSPYTAWKTITKVNESSFVPGDYILFKRGEVYREQLNVLSSGAPGNPITYGAYGDGEKPIISGADIITGFTQSAGEEMAEQQPNTGANVPLRDTSDHIYIGNSFGADSNITIGQVDVPVKRVGTPSGFIWIEIWSKSGGNPGALIGASNRVSARGLTSSLAWTPFTFPTPLSITASTTYYFLLAGDFAFSRTNYVQSSVVTNDNYRGTSYCRIMSATAAPTWTTYPGHDAAFKIYNQTSGGNVYQKTGITTEPTQVFYNGAKLTAHDGATASVGLNEWDCDSNALYINVGEEPSTGTIEISQRTTAATNSGNYISFDGLHFTKSNGTIFGNLWSSGTNGIIRDCEFSWGSHHGVVYTGSGDNVLTLCDIHDNGIAASSSGVFGYQDAGSSGHENYISHNRIFNNYSFGIQLFSNYYIIEYNELFDNGNTTYMTSGIEIMDWAASGYGQHHIIRYNYISGQISGVDDGEGIYADEFSRYVAIYYNVVHGCDGPGIASNRANDVNIFNNSVYGNSKNSSGQLNIKTEIKIIASAPGESSNVVVKNNIGQATKEGTYAIYVDANTYNMSGLNITNNDWFAVAANWYSWNATGGNNLAAWNALTGVGTDFNSDPLFTDPANRNFSIKGKSACRDAGTDVGLTQDFKGNSIVKTPDVGAYEYRELAEPINLRFRAIEP